jgi:hypothetical protein
VVVVVVVVVTVDYDDDEITGCLLGASLLGFT